jgi:copper chaperone CopZ
MSDTTKQVELSGMHCQSCVNSIGEALRQVPGVRRAEVTLTPPRAIVHVATGTSDETIRAAVRSAGDYDATTIQSATSQPQAAESSPEPQESLYPLLLIVGFIAAVTVLAAIRTGSFGLNVMMANFMAGFFIVFGFFKLLDLPGFVRTYRTYDLLAKAAPGWGWAYPFVELALGAAYLLGLFPVVTNLVTLVVMLIGAAGVGIALANRQRIRCACLGTVLNLPMTTITLVEDLGMAAMAGAMLILLQSG